MCGESAPPQHVGASTGRPAQHHADGIRRTPQERRRKHRRLAQVPTGHKYGAHWMTSGPLQLTVLLRDQASASFTTGSTARACGVSHADILVMKWRRPMRIALVNGP